MKLSPMDYIPLRRPVIVESSRRWSFTIRFAAAFALIVTFLLFQSNILGTSAAAHQEPSKHAWDVEPQAALENVRNSTLGFEKIFAVVMSSRHDRRDALALAAAQTGMDIIFVDGIKGDDVAEKTLPPHDAPNGGLNMGTLGAWRSHANILREIVQKNISSALVLESDADWDVRLKDQLVDYALATRALVQPVAGTTDKYHDTTYRGLSRSDDARKKTEPMLFRKFPATMPSKTSPYGEGWDILHIGHCGVRSPLLNVPPQSEELASHLPKRYVVYEDNMTVPEPHYLHSYSDEKIEPFRQIAPRVNHTRIYHHSLNFVCTHGFGISQQGARRLLQYTAMRKLDAPFDAMMEHYCQNPKLADRRGPCLATQPPLMGQHRPAGDITKDFEIKSPWFEGVSGSREKGFTHNIRLSAKENMANIAYGYRIEDQYPDTVMFHTT